MEIPPVSTKAYQAYKMNIEQDKNILEQKCVFIDAQDIQLPLTSGNFDPQENRTYSFYVWAYDPDQPQTALEDLRRNGTFSLEVVGVKASISVPNYLPAAGPPQQLLNNVTNGLSVNDIQAMESRNVFEIRVRSQDITGPFKIVAWFPEKYRDYSGQVADGLVSSTNSTDNSTENPYGEKRDIKVYNGDLRTRIDIVDEREAEASFGKLFSQYFYVGRIYLRNRHPDKRMVVYTTSLRANILLYRPPVTQPTPPTTQYPAKSPNPPTPVWDTQYAQTPLTLDESNELTTNGLYQGMKVTYATELGRAITTAFAEYNQNQSTKPWDDTDRPMQACSVVDRNLVKKSLETSNQFYLRKAQAAERVNLVWTRLDQYVKAAEDKSRTLAGEAQSLARDEVSSIPTGTDEEQVLRVNVMPALFRLGAMGNDAEVLGHYCAATNTISQSGLGAPERARLNTLAHQVYVRRIQAGQQEQLALALRNNAPQMLDDTSQLDDSPELSISVSTVYDSIVYEIRSEALGNSRVSPNPFAKMKDILVNTDARALAYSDDSDRQVQMANVGYLWHETYRPMTFQAVLNSLMYTHDNSYSARTVAIMQALAGVAGGMVGLGAFVKEFNSSGYLEGVNLFSTIFVPATSKLILDDLNKYIRNLGEMGMDTVMVVPPNDVVDRYIFFPKGPIYNFVDEFNVSDPAYIKSVDNDDVSVEATLIDQGVSVQGGGLSSSTLVDRALNEGQADATAELLKEADLRERLRQLQLTSLASQIENLLINTQPTDTNGIKSQKRLQAEKQVCDLVKNFKAQFGEDSTGALQSLLSQNQVDCDSSPPTVVLSAVQKVDVLGGVPSQQYLLPVSDVMGAWTLKITNSSSNPDFVSPTNVNVVLPVPGGNSPVQFTVLAATNAAQAESGNLFLTFTISNLLGLSTNLPVPVSIHMPQLTFQPVPSMPGFKLTESALVLSSPDRVAFVNAVLPVYGSDLSGDLTNHWSFTVANPSSTNGWIIKTDSQGLRKSQTTDMKPAITLFLTIDPSLVTTNKLDPVTFPLSLRYDNRTIVQTNVQVVIQPDTANPL